MDEIALEEGKLDELRKQLLNHEAALAYIRVGRVIRGDTTADETRINWNTDALSTYLHTDDLAENPADMVDAVITWLRRTIQNNWDGGTAQVWKVRGYSAKGETTLFTMRVHASYVEPPEEPTEIPKPVDDVRPPTENAWDALDRGYRQLGHAQVHLGKSYAQFAEIALGWQRRLMGIATELQQQTMEHLNADRTHLRKHAQDLSQRLDAVISEFSTFKVDLLGLGLDVAQVGLHQQGKQQSQEVATKLGEKFMGTLGELGTAYFAAQGLTPTMAKLLRTLTDDPELNAVLNDPDLPGLLDDQANRQMLATLLKQGLMLYRQQKAEAEAAKQAEAARQAEAAKQTEAAKQQSGQPNASPPGGI